MTIGASVMCVPRFFFARIASTRASGCSSCTQLAAGSASTAMMPCSVSAAASAAVSARRACTPSTTVSPNRIASEKHTVRRIDVGCGRSVSTRRMPARYSRKAIPVAMSPAPRITTNMAFSSVYLRCILQTITITTDDYSVSVE